MIPNFLKLWVRGLRQSQQRPHRRVWLASRLRPGIEVLEDRSLPSITYTVTNTNDSGAGSLRQAILDANNTTLSPGLDTINFSIAGAGVHIITPLSTLPTITDPVVINGYSQPNASANSLAVGNDAVLLIELNGTSAAGSGLTITGGGSTIRGLVINRFVGQFTDAGINVLSSNNVIDGCFIGVDPTGTIERANLYGGGVRVFTGANNLIGGTTPAARNVISGNGGGYNGNIAIERDGSLPPSLPVPTGTLIRGNYIGTNAAGTAFIHDPGTLGASVGVTLGMGTGTIIGGTDADDGAVDGNVGARNLISGNYRGINTGAYSGYNNIGVDVTVQGNFIGVNAAGTAALGNYLEGINFVPQDNTGTTSITIGGTAAGAGNVISGQTFGSGVYVLNSDLVMQGNRIGTDLAGTLDLGNGGYGVEVTRGGSPPYTVRQITIGGATPEARNIISGNTGPGMRLWNYTGAYSSMTVQGNYIGVQSDGTTLLANGGVGIFAQDGPATIGGTGAGEANVIAGNGAGGVSLDQAVARVTVLSNSFFANVGAGISGSGAPKPTLTSVTATTITGTLVGAVTTTYRVEFFATPDTGPTANDEGKSFLGFLDVPIDGTGTANFTFTPAGGVPGGQFVTATATGPSTSTSTFSAFVVAPASQTGTVDLQLTINDNLSSTTPGSTLTYRLDYTNVGNRNASGVVLTEQLPLGTTFHATGSTAGWTETATGSGVFTLDVADLAGDASGFALFLVDVKSVAAAGQTQIVNTASIADDGENGSDPTPTDNTDTDTDTLVAAPDLQISNSAGVTSASPGSTLTFTLIYRNVGTQSATGVKLTETLPTGTTFNAGASTLGWTETAPGSHIFKFPIGNLGGGSASTSVDFAVTVNNPAAAGQTEIADTASIADDGLNGADPTPADNSATARVPLTQPDAGIAHGVIAVPVEGPQQLLTITFVSRSAAYHSELGLFLVDDASGRIGTLQPGDAGYAAAALARHQVIFQRTDRPGIVRKLTLPSGSFFALYLVQNGSSRDYLARSQGKQRARQPQMFFSIPTANADHFDHVLWSTANQFGFEDFTGGGDRDFNDLVARFAFTPQNPRVVRSPTKHSGSR